MEYVSNGRKEGRNERTNERREGIREERIERDGRHAGK